VEKLSTILADPKEYMDKRGGLASHMGKYSWELVIDKYDKELEELSAMLVIDMRDEIYGLPIWAFAGASDAKVMDAQAGAEAMMMEKEEGDED